METRKRRSNRHNRPGALLLAAVLVCALFAGTASAAPGNVNTFTLLKANEPAPKPIVTIQGNVVVDKNKPTGYYELALCVQTGRVVRDNTTGRIVNDQLYADALKEAEEKNDQSIVTNFLQTHTVTYYPFQSAGAAVYVNLDVLTPVTWSAEKPIYSAWDGTHYHSADTQYPRGLDPDTPDQPNKMFSKLEPVMNDKGDRVMVRLDTAKPDEVTNATALVEWAEFNTVDTSKRTALLTLTANTTTTPNVIYEKPTPVVVVRFAYDMERFENLEVGDPLGDQADPKNQNHSDFWLGLDKNSTLPSEGPGTNVDSAAQIPLTYLAASTTGGTNKYADSDAKAAASSVSQTVWYRANLNSDHIEQDETNFYYYLGAEDLARDPAQKVQIDNGTLTPDEPSLLMPKTVGDAAVAKKSVETELRTPGDPEPDANYSFFQNLLRRSDDTLRLHLVNAETYRKPTGGGGTTILFYDWDDTLIGSLVVDKGDVRAEVEEYIEENLVHPDLRPGTLLDKMGGKVDYSTPPAPGSDAQAYRELITSTERKDTYRGKYAYTVGGNDTVGAEGDTTNQGRADGADYPLTNKLDYVFTKRVNTELRQEVTDADGSYTARYILPHDPTDANMVDAALYPYTYGWAVVEDTSTKNQMNWKVMYDATRLEDTWTTVGVGELSEVDPDYYANGGAAKTMPAVTASDKYVAPAFLADEDENWTDNTAGLSGQAGYTDKYAYQLNSNGSAGYLRFADFSDIDTELALYKKKNGGNKDTLIVKAVYEPGKALLPESHYRLSHIPYYNKMNNLSSGLGASYSVEIELERADYSQGQVQGVARTRLPAIRQDTTADNKWLKDDRIPDHDADNADDQTAINKTETSFVQAQMVDGDTVTYTLTLSARHNKANSFLIEQYGLNYVVGGERTESNYNRTGTDRILDNYNYYDATDSDTKDNYLDVQNYAEKEGSRGFVLVGTLNSMMEQATRYRHGEIKLNDYRIYTSEENLIDANIRSSTGALAAWDNVGDIQDAIIEAAKQCEAHKGDPNYWNSERNCAQLNYHQLQRFIITGTLPTDENDDEHPGTPISWCHLHADCAATVSNKPKNWSELIEKAKAGADKDIKDLLLDELQAMTRLRTDLNGSPFTDRDYMADYIVAAVQNGCESWNDIQYYILHAKKPTTDEEKKEAGQRYWWYDNATSNPAPADLPALITVLKASKDPPLNPPPDGDTTPRTSKLYSIAPIVAENAAEKGESITAQWRRLTHNLVASADENGAPIRFKTYDEFVAALSAAVEKAPSATGADKTSWTTLQKLILEAAADPNPPTTTDYYWYDGGRRITSLAEMIAAAQEYHSGDASLWNTLTQTMFTGFADPTKDSFWYFADAFKMTRFLDFTDSADYEAFKTTFLAWVGTPGASVSASKDVIWQELQYMMIHGNVLDVSAAYNECTIGGFYWWKDNGTAGAYDLSADNFLTNVAAAFFSYEINGNTHALDNLDMDIVKLLNLKSLAESEANTWGYDSFLGDTKPNGNNTADADHNTRDAMADVTEAQFKTAMGNMVRSYLNEQVTAGNGHGHELPPALVAHEMQYAILNGGAYKRFDDMSAVTVGTGSFKNGYWWLSTAEAPNKWVPPKVEVEPPQEWKNFVAKLNSDSTKVTITANDLSNANVMLSYNSTKWATVGRALATAKKRLALAVAGIEADGGTAADLTWYQLQVALTDGGYQDAAAAYNLFKDVDWTPEWVKQKWDPNYVAP